MMQPKGIYFFSVRDKYFAYDINSTYCVELDRISLTILPELLSGVRKGLEEKYTHVYSLSQIRRCIKECKGLLKSGSFGTQSIPYKHTIQNNISSICLHIAHKCNLTCEYCYADAGSFGGKRALMSRDVMKKAVDFALANSGSIKEINIGFFGGEPLLNFNLICECAEYAKEKAAKHSKQITFSMASNALLLTQKIMDFISKENFSLLFSLDGPQKIHDRMRRFPSGQGTHYHALKNIKEYFNHYSEDFTVRGTFTRTTPNFSDQVIFLNEQGFKSISVEPAQLAINNPHSISTCGDISRILREYDRLSDVYIENFNKDRPLHFFHFDNYLKKLLNPQPTHVECGAGGRFIAITPDGKIFPCFESVVEKENCIGHVESGFDRQKRKIFQSMHVDARTECRGCWLKYFCGGGCHAFNIRYNNDIKMPYKPQCEFIKHRFKLAVWILSEITGKGERAIKKLQKHLQSE
jgi:uncharacterized protein